VVLRPDGILAFAAELNQGEVVGGYFDDIIPERVQNGSHAAI
jgi:hypothetical protein